MHILELCVIFKVYNFANMSWTDNKTLLEYSKYTPCQEIFQAVCDELGKHFITKGFKYSGSRPKLTIEKGDIKLVIGFYSSRSNTPGQWVALEILPGFYSKQLSKTGKTKGLLLEHTALFSHKYTDNPKQIKVRQIFGDELERIDEYSLESKIKDNHICNVYALDKEKFDSIVNFIDAKIIPWITKLSTEEEILELTQNANATRKWSLLNTDFVKYVQLNFPGIDIAKELSS